MATEERAASDVGGESPPRGAGARPMPLNSRRVTRPVLRSLAAELGLPTTSSNEDLRQMVDGKLTDMGRQPRDVLVVVESADTAEDEGPTRVRLHDGEVSFLDAELLTTKTPGPAISGEDASAEGEDDRSLDRDKLTADAERYRTELEISRAELARTKNEVEGVKKRVKEVWRMNCDLV